MFSWARCTAESCPSGASFPTGFPSRRCAAASQVAATVVEMFAFLDSLFDRLQDVSTSQWFYLIVLAVAFLDSVIPVVPSETAVILGGIAAGQGDLNVGLVIAAGAFGAMSGDNFAYGIGRRFSGPIQQWYGKKPKRAKQLAWAAEQLRARGGSLLLTARFVPGGRTVITLTSGITRQKRLRFVVFVALACAIWASYGAGLGYFYGNQFKDDHTKAFLIAFGTALGFTFLLEIGRYVRRKRKGVEEPAIAATLP
jgi:membrane-associated protein